MTRRPAPTALVVARRLCRSRSVVIGGHGVGVSPGPDPHNLRVHPDRFRAQVELLLAAGFRFVSVGDLAREAGGAPPPPGRAALSFDDGLEDNASVLLPLLHEYAIPATVFVATGLMGRPNPDLHGTRMLTEDEVRSVAEAGVEIGAHTVSHADLAQLPPDVCREEVTASRAVLRSLTGRSVDMFAYPWGSVSPVATAAVQAAGFRAAVTADARGGWAPLAIGRAMITGLDGLGSFLAKLGGVYDPVFTFGPTAAARAATRGPRRVVRRLRQRV